jgi:hypothetical protein
MNFFKEFITAKFLGLGLKLKTLKAYVFSWEFKDDVCFFLVDHLYPVYEYVGTKVFDFIEFVCCAYERCTVKNIKRLVRRLASEGFIRLKAGLWAFLVLLATGWFWLV